jgi:hypothetical protein
MVLQANPARARAAEEKEEISKKYKPGDVVLLPESAIESSESDEDDRRLLANVRELSLNDIPSSHRRRASSNAQSGESFRNRRPRSSDNRNRSDDERSGHRHGEERGTRRQAQQNVARNAARNGTLVGDADSTRRIEHQSSLRSLLSASDVETPTQEEIVRLIMDEGLLDGIDFGSLNQAQEEELSDRLVQIFLNRHPEHSNLRRRSSDQTERPAQGQHRRSRSQTVQAPSTMPASAESSRHPPVSRPRLLDAAAAPAGHHRRLSDQESRRRRTSPTPVAPASTSETSLRPAVRSSSDITSHRPRPSPTRFRTRESSAASPSRRATEPEGRISETWLGAGRDPNTQQSGTARHVLASPQSSSPTVSTPTEQACPTSANPLPGGVSAAELSAVGVHLSSGHRNTASRPGSSRQHPSRIPSTHYAEPSISCDRCDRPNIQYDPHKRCSRCKDGHYHLCLRCCREGRGCLQGVGSGKSGQANFENDHPPSTSLEATHALLSQRYRRPREGASRGMTGGKQTTIDNPAGRLEEGLFCDICKSGANDCFWQCGECNDGDWGYCQRCVNQGRCCNHRLLPIRRSGSDDIPVALPDSTHAVPAPVPAPLNSAADSASYQVLSFSTKCDLCTYPIPPSSTRFHCPQCHDGDYDICTNCYLKLVASGKISKDNGHNGWRRCVNGHRMIVVGFEDHDHGQRRVVVRDLVGGHTFKDELGRRQGGTPSASSMASPEIGSGDWSWKEGHNVKRKKAGRSRNPWPGDSTTDLSSPSSPASSPAGTQSSTASPSTRRLGFPPDGGVGLVLSALWPYWPEDDVTDELSFPRGAEITEADNINDEWYWGYYAGSTGLFPGAFCTIVREVS